MVKQSKLVLSVRNKQQPTNQSLTCCCLTIDSDILHLWLHNNVTLLPPLIQMENIRNSYWHQRALSLEMNFKPKVVHGYCLFSSEDGLI